MKNKKNINTFKVWVIVFLILITVTACGDIQSGMIIDGNINIKFLEPNVGVEILAAEDEYIQSFSKFDYMAKFKTEKMPDRIERIKLLKNNVLSWEKKEKEKIMKVVSEIDKKIQKFNLNLPDEIGIIKISDWVESGASHTRDTSIVFSESFINDSSEREFKTVFTHELFHIYSRYNKEIREELYGIINYKKTGELVFPKEIKDLKISNPDAVENNYYIKCLYGGKEYSFIPILYASEEYDINSNETFFKYVRDEMLAVEIKNNKPIPIYLNNQPLIVEKEDLDNYYELIGNNTDYTYHPEETLADNFVLLVLDKEVESTWVLEKMRTFFEREI